MSDKVDAKAAVGDQDFEKVDQVVVLEYLVEFQQLARLAFAEDKSNKTAPHFWFDSKAVSIMSIAARI